MAPLQYRWVIFLYRREVLYDKEWSTVWFDSLQQCQYAANKFTVDVNYAHTIEYESRAKPAEDGEAGAETVEEEEQEEEDTQWRCKCGMQRVVCGEPCRAHTLRTRGGLTVFN
jgi:hypothetical protein